ncbi:hypothetical protein FRC09_011610 [Ceratobasidium sp. 395]|nr:hypothetical protein FRC09_011610 [Ceratobasidium sp. 395]
MEQTVEVAPGGVAGRRTILLVEPLHLANDRIELGPALHMCTVIVPHRPVVVLRRLAALLPLPSAEERAARLAAMSADAASMQSERNVRLAKIKVLEEAEAAKEEEERMRASKEGGKGAFMRDQEKALYGGGGGGMDLAERLRRGRKDLVRERD